MALRVLRPETGPASGWRRADGWRGDHLSMTRARRPVRADGASDLATRRRQSPPDRRPAPGARPPRRRRAAHHGGTGAGSRRQRRRHPRHGRRRIADRRSASRGRAIPIRPIPSHPGPELVPGPGSGRGDLARRGRGRDVFGHAAGWRHRLGQDRGLPGGDRPGAARGPPGAGAAAGDRAVLAMAVAVSSGGSAWRRPCGTPT